MILRSIELESFGKFKNKTVEFRRGMNLVIGPNEAGKSTLAEAVPAVLFGTNRLEKYKTWGRNACSAALFFEGGGRTIQVKRNLLTDEVELVEKDDLYHVLSQFSGKAPLRGRSASCREYRELVESLLGVGDDKLFRATYFFGHHPQEWSGDELAQRLRTLVSGTAEADYAAILDGLLDEHFSLTNSNPWGRDKQREREYEEVCRQLEQQGDHEAVPMFVEIDAGADIAAQIEALTAELVRDRLEYEKGLRYVERVRRETSAEMAEAAGVAEVVASDIEVIDEPAAEKVVSGSLSAELTAAGLPAQPPRELPALLEEATDIRQEMAELQQPYSILNQKEKKIPDVPWVALGGAAVLCVVLAGLAWWLSLYAIPVTAGAGFITAALLGWGGVRQTARKKAQADCQKQRGRLDQKKYAAQARQAELSERCEALGLPSSPIDLVRLQKLVAKHRSLLDRFWSGQEEAGPDVKTEERPKPGAVSKVEAQEAPAKNSDSSPEVQELQARMAEFESQLQEKESRLESLKVQLEEASQARPAQGSASGGALYKRKYELEERISLLRKSVNLLAGAVDEFSRSHLVKLNEEAGRMFGKITAGRYNEVRLDENMLPSVKIDGRRWVPVDNFSRGTVDAIYLALRVALAKVRGDGRSLPLMLDDPFVHLDQKRLAKALNMVDLASADGQLILFSHNMELGKRAAKERWHVVPLDGDGAETNSEEEGGEHAGQLHLL